MGFLPPVIMEVRAKASEVFSELGKVREETKKTASETEASGSKMGRAFKSAGAAGGAITLGVVGAAAAIGGFSLEAAMASQVTEARLSTAIKNVGGDAEKFKPQMEAAAEGVVKFGYTNNQGQQALANLTTALGDPKKAMASLSVAANLAREKNISLQESAMLVAKASEGQVRPLRALGIDLPVYAGNAQAVALANKKLQDAQQKVKDILAATPDAADAASKAHAKYEQAVGKVTAAQALLQAKQSSGDKIMQTLSERVKGQAAAYGETLKGKMDSAKASLEGLGEKIGGYIIPVVENLSKTGAQLFTWLTKNQGVLIALGSVVGVVAGTLVALWVAQKVGIAVMAIARAAMIAYNVVAGVFGVITKASIAASYGQAGATYANVAAQKAYAIGAGIAKVATLAWVGIQWLLNAAMDANPVMLIVLAVIALIAIIVLLVTHWKEVCAFLTTVWQHVADFFVTVGNAIASWWNGLWNAITSFVIGVWTGFVNWIIGVIQFWVRGFMIEGAALNAWWTTLWNNIISFVTGIWNAVSNFVSSVWNNIVRFFQVAGAVLHAAWVGTWNIIISTVRSIWGGVSSFVGSVWNNIIGFFQSAGATISGIWNGLWSGLASVVSGAFNGVVGTVRSVINGVIGVVNSVIGTINGALSAGKAVGINVSIPSIPSLGIGGWTPGSKGQPTFAVIHGGEFMLSADMLAGRQPIPKDVQALLSQNAKAFTEGSTSSAGKGRSGSNIHVDLTANTNSSPAQIASALGWGLRRAG